MEYPQNTTNKIYCHNPKCQTPNPLEHKFCQKCRTPLAKRYLWLIGGQISHGVKELIHDRYLVESSRIVLDTKPGMIPCIPDEIPESIVPYLKLATFRIQIPQVYGLLFPNSNQWLLEQAPIHMMNRGRVDLFPDILSEWGSATALKQLSWLHQMAALWTPMSNLGVNYSLLNPELLRVNGGNLQLRELMLNGSSSVPLIELIRLWLSWSNTHPIVKKVLDLINQEVQRNLIRHSDGLISRLDEGLKEVGKWHNRTYQIVARTDSGPTRPHNEDDCSPRNNAILEYSTDNSVSKIPLAIVCDGIGGHEGGEVASTLAVETIENGINLLPNSYQEWSPPFIKNQLTNLIYKVNDIISQRNDRERRSERQRMGTTVILAISHPQDYQVYTSHIGDSRIYKITRTGCRQLTLDDDVASREVRLGYNLYRSATQYHGSGSLIQALGMNPSTYLHPTVQRFIVDEDAIFLLCSDGLSDYDRVEEYWESELLPVLNQGKDLTMAIERLIEIANTKNGHDNVTIAGIYCQVGPPTMNHSNISFQNFEHPQTVIQSEPYVSATSSPSQQPTQKINTPKKSSVLLFIKEPSILLSVIFAVGIILGAIIWNVYSRRTIKDIQPVIFPTLPKTTPRDDKDSGLKRPDARSTDKLSPQTPSKRYQKQG